jgi:hypothetical protein
MVTWLINVYHTLNPNWTIPTTMTMTMAMTIINYWAARLKSAMHERMQ